MKKIKFNQELINLFSKKTGCAIQYNDCPCNTCFHSIEDVDFQHICWLIILGLRGDYPPIEVMENIEKELKLKQ